MIRKQLKIDLDHQKNVYTSDSEDLVLPNKGESCFGKVLGKRFRGGNTEYLVSQDHNMTNVAWEPIYEVIESERKKFEKQITPRQRRAKYSQSQSQKLKELEKKVSWLQELLDKELQTKDSVESLQSERIKELEAENLKLQERLHTTLTEDQKVLNDKEYEIFSLKNILHEKKTQYKETQKLLERSQSEVNFLEHENQLLRDEKEKMLNRLQDQENERSLDKDFLDIHFQRLNFEKLLIIPSQLDGVSTEDSLSF